MKLSMMNDIYLNGMIRCRNKAAFRAHLCLGYKDVATTFQVIMLNLTSIYITIISSNASNFIGLQRCCNIYVEKSWQTRNL